MLCSLLFSGYIEVHLFANFLGQPHFIIHSLKNLNFFLTYLHAINTSLLLIEVVTTNP